MLPRSHHGREPSGLQSHRKLQELNMTRATKHSRDRKLRVIKLSDFLLLQQLRILKLTLIIRNIRYESWHLEI